MYDKETASNCIPEWKFIWCILQILLETIILIIYEEGSTLVLTIVFIPGSTYDMAATIFQIELQLWAFFFFLKP